MIPVRKERPDPELVAEILGTYQFGPDFYRPNPSSKGFVEHLDPDRWWTSIADAGIDVERQVHEKYELMDKLPWDHVNVKFGRGYLEKEQGRATVQLAELAKVQS